MKKNLLSIIVPIYNVEEFLPRCIDSLLDQSYKNVEIILVDDGSTDKSGFIADEYRKKDERIVVVHKKNGGLSDARNAGISKASGNYLTFVDSDDYIEKNIYTLAINKMIDTGVDILVFEIVKDYGNGKNKKLKLKEEKILNRDSALIELNTFRNLDFSACNKIYKKEMFENIDFPVGKKCEDVYTLYKVFYRASKVYLLPKEGYYYCYREGSITHSKKVNLDYVYAFKKQTEFFESNNNDNLLSIAKCSYAYSCLNIANTMIRNNINDKNLLNKIRNEAKKNSVFVYRNHYLRLSKKTQFFIFDKCYFLYRIVIKLKDLL